MPKIVRRKVIIPGQGTAYVTVRHTDHGTTEYLRRVTHNGVKRLRPIEHVHLKHAPTKEIHIDPKRIEPDEASAVTGLTALVKSNNIIKMGGGVRPTRNLIMREINHALRKR